MEEKVRAAAKLALENMYMFGGMPKPDPKYDEYLGRMVETVVAATREPEPTTNEEFRERAEDLLNAASDMLDRIEGLSEEAESDLDSVKLSVSYAIDEVDELDLDQ